MDLPPALAAIYLQAAQTPDQNRVLLDELQQVAAMASGHSAGVVPFRLGPAPSHCTLCGQSLQTRSHRSGL